MLIVTSETINGKNFEMLGVVKGSTIQTVNAFKDIGSGLKTLVGGELGNYNKMMEKAREMATSRMIEEAQKLGADAIICVRYSSSSIAHPLLRTFFRCFLYSEGSVMVFGVYLLRGLSYKSSSSSLPESAASRHLPIDEV